jgi:hypothetical protein
MKQIRRFHFRHCTLYRMKNTITDASYFGYPNFPSSYFNTRFQLITRYFENKNRMKLKKVRITNHKRILDKRLTGKRGTRK